MKSSNRKGEKIKPKTATSTPARPRRRARRVHKPRPTLYEAVLAVDTLAARMLERHPLDAHRLLIIEGPEDDLFVVWATVSATQLLKLATWAASMEPNVTVYSPAPLCELVKLMTSEAGEDGITVIT